MNERNNPKLTALSQNLRKEMTREEKHLWYDFLKKLPTTVNRQKVFGIYIVDFYCANAKLVIELDGKQHYDEDGREADRVRDEYLNNLGITVVRYTNRQIRENFVGVCKDIEKRVGNTSSTASGPPCLPAGRSFRGS
ncbi:MAG: DUF559 domain-containing protein [Ruminococcaceae bacterium]|nr:DUF559 domain-containing protein [Oscillospiraceae bacterium]